MTAGDQTRCAVVGAIVVEKGQSVHRIAGPLCRQVAVQALITTACQRLPALHLCEKKRSPINAPATASNGGNRQTACTFKLRSNIEWRQSAPRCAGH
jgi:hypothetical protein